MTHELTIKQDINFLEYSLWIQDKDLANKSEGHIWKDRDGYIYRAGYKPPVKTDFLFLLSFLMQSQQEEWKDEIICSKYSILKKCGIARNENWYQRIEESLKRWKMVGIEFQGTFYDGKAYKTMNFGIIDDWRLEKETGRLIIRINKLWLLKIKESNFFKYINFNEIKLLKSPLVVRLYEILLKNFQGRNVWEIDALKLALKIPMNEKHVAHIIVKIEAAIKRINKHTDLKIKLTTIRPERGKALFRFEKISKETIKELPSLPPVSIVIPVDESFKKLIEILPEEHRNKNTVLEIIEKYYKKHGFYYVSNNIKYTNLYSKGNYRAYLQRSLMENWGEIIREEEESKIKAEEERKRKEAEERERARKEIERKAEEDRRIEEDKERTRQARDYIEKLSKKDRTELEEECLQEYIIEYKKRQGQYPLNRPPDPTIMAFMVSKIRVKLNL